MVIKKCDIIREIKEKLIDLKNYYPESNIKLSASCSFSAKTGKDVKVEITEHFMK
jgi:hypothetical protein